MSDPTCCNDDSAEIVCVLPIYHRGPHAYPLAVALRHAADRIEADGTSDLYPQWSADALRDWADEATP